MEIIMINYLFWQTTHNKRKAICLIVVIMWLICLYCKFLLSLQLLKNSELYKTKEDKYVSVFRLGK